MNAPYPEAVQLDQGHPQNVLQQGHTRLDFDAQSDDQDQALPESPNTPDAELAAHAEGLIAAWEPAMHDESKSCLPERLEQVRGRLKKAVAAARQQPLDPVQLRILRGRRLLDQVVNGTEAARKELDLLPHVHIPREGTMPRIVSLAETYLALTHGIWSASTLATYVSAAQRKHPLLMGEIQVLPQALKFAQVEYILDRLDESAKEAIPAAIFSLERQQQFEWQPQVEALVSFDSILRQDPAGVYPTMDVETRHTYRRRVAHLAQHADFNEVETAYAALELARRAHTVGDPSASPDPRRAERIGHIGYFLLGEGLVDLKRRIGFHAPWPDRIRDTLRSYNDDFYLTGIIVVTLLLIVPITAPLVPYHEFWLVIFALLLALLPVTQGAVDLMNGIVQAILKTEALPKIDLSRGVPDNATTLVAVPTLLLRGDQVQELFEDLEARYLANEDPNIHFALLTDLPDSATEPLPDEADPLVRMAIQLTENLNAKYAEHHAHGGAGRFFLLHRHRVFNHRQGVWMGWERKRGKLLDLNKLLLRDYDSFPIKAGPAHLLDRIRYVITLDSDTKLPAGAAHRMIGTMHHPLNRAIVNPRLGIVTAGYGILQPRVGVSVASASRSRLAAIYSGETGLDIYTHAVSDVYQDLFGEGIFTGKGIYEVAILHQVLERRFPRNSLLSHDLIEGAYVRAGLVSDVEVIDDYPSQYAAHTRRSHRWIRGDWQILRWLFSPVPDESNRLVPNPISLISKWKILDNLRRSLVEPVTFLVLVFGWFFLPGGALYWTLITVALLLLPATVQLGLDLLRAVLTLTSGTARAGFRNFGSALAVSVIHLTFLPHQMLLSLDAIVRSITRTFISGHRLLEWETAAQAETSSARTSLDIYLQLSAPLAIAIALVLGLVKPRGLFAAGPVLCLWLAAPFAVRWLNSPPRSNDGEISAEDRSFLYDQAQRIWRFYQDFAGPEHYFLVPDHVEERGYSPVRLLTPTNVGMLLNARLAAYSLGFSTLLEFTHNTLGSLASYARLEKYRGHLFNWYDLVTLRPIHPVEVSTVDSGNLAASLYTLRAGALDLMKRPLVCPENFIDVGRATADSTLRDAVSRLCSIPIQPVVTPPGTAHDRWCREELERRRAALSDVITQCLPWLLPAYEALAAESPELRDLFAQPAPTCDTAEFFITRLSQQLAQVGRPLAEELRNLLDPTLTRIRQLRADLQNISDQAERFAEEMDFAFLFVESRQLLANGFDRDSAHLHKTCFDLLATEARTAAFLAVAKGEIPQQSWFRLDRSHTLVKGRPVLLSWTATMFEHLMPTLWMRSHPDTLLTNSLETVIQVQIDHVRNMPWGISESGYGTTDAEGHYFYQAWGIPTIALKMKAEDGPVISPYSTYLALPLARRAALQNLRRMALLGWQGEYGLYEAADYIQREGNPPRRAWESSEPILVRTWMAHHMGMSLLAITNVLRANIFQDWFHANPRVRAAEQLLHEKPLSREMLNRLERESAADHQNVAGKSGTPGTRAAA